VKQIIFIASALVLLAACKPRQKSISDFQYFEKNRDSLNNMIVQLKEPVIQKHDQLSIFISSASLNQEQAQVFNLLNGGGGVGGGAVSGGAGMQGYLVDYDGTINLPLIGKVEAAGLTKNQLTEILVQKLEPFVKNPVVNIRFLDFRVMLMGETSRKGWITFPNEKATIVDALGQTGGLTDQGKRNDILLIRENPDGKIETHTVDFNDAMIYKSPYFQLQQNDIIYVLPNQTRLLQYERSNSPFFRDLPLYMGMITAIIGFTALIVSIFR
jgi:polysaccharide export outer membrane protein